MVGHEGQKTEITVHFYNHNKPKDKKQSIFLIQGRIQSFICEFVFCELPKIYKLVCLRKVPSVSSIRYPKRKRIATPIKKRNIRYKPAAKQGGINCAICDFASVSNVKMIRHMKTSHTEPCYDKDVSGSVKTSVPRQTLLDEDMSVFLISDDEEASGNGSEELLAENLNEEVIPPVVKPLPLYKCNECSFATTNTASLREHKKNSHVKERTNEEEVTFLHSCISCEFKTNDYSKLLEHSDSNHKNESDEILHSNTTEGEPRSNDKGVTVCGICGNNGHSDDDCVKHTSDQHSQIECDKCSLKFDTSLGFEWHLETEHEVMKSYKCSACTLYSYLRYRGYPGCAYHSRSWLSML